jgi:hypothetical protein
VNDIVNRPEKVTEVTMVAKDMVIKKYDWKLIADDMKRQVFDPLFEQNNFDSTS